MSAVLVIIVAIIVIWRLYVIGKIVFSIDFLFGFLLVLDFLYAYSATMSGGGISILPLLGPIIVGAGIIALYRYVSKSRRRRTQLSSGGWTIFSGIIMIIILGIFAYVVGYRYGTVEKLIAFIVIGAVLLASFKPFRLPWFVCVNILLLGLLAFRLDQGMNGNDGLTTVDTSSGDMSSGDMSSLSSSNVSFNDGNTFTGMDSSAAFSGGDVMTAGVGTAMLGGFQNFSNNTFAMDPTPFVNSLQPGQSITLNDNFGAPTMSFRDGMVYGQDSLPIGSYNASGGNTVFYDANHQVAFSVDSSGNYYDNLHQYMGKSVDTAMGQTFVDAQGQTAYRYDNSGTIFDDKGQVVGSVKKA